MTSEEHKRNLERALRFYDSRIIFERETVIRSGFLGLQRTTHRETITVNGDIEPETVAALFGGLASGQRQLPHEA